ncbi:MAG: hypothetical protein M0P69_13025, partial [Bacteroidales bacterium]|nr:hypothetical protein [Bacteroidales bacterium]
PQFIWDALLKTPSVTVQKAGKPKVIEYKCPDFEQVPDARCWLCGGDTGGIGRLKKRHITKMFSDTEYAQENRSESLCVGCGGLLSNASMRFYSLLATEKGISHPTRREWRDILLVPPQGIWAGGLAISCQKHLFYRMTLNFSAVRCIVALEDFRVLYQPGHLDWLLGRVEPMLAVFSKEEIRTGQYRQNRIREYGLKAWQKAEAIIHPLRGNPLLDLVLYVAVKKGVDADATAEDNGRTG